MDQVQVIIRRQSGFRVARRTASAVSALFDADYYRRQNPDVAAAGGDPFAHYFTIGWAEGRNPCALFENERYLTRYADVAASGVNPLLHYADTGGVEGREPHPLFHARWYLDQNPDVVAAGVNPLVHYLTAGAEEGRAPNPLFDGAWYLKRHPDVSGLNPLAHYTEFGSREGRAPHPLFDAAWYLERYPDVKNASADPLAHFLERGGIEKRDPNAFFDAHWYAARNPDVAASGLPPLLHYAARGWREGRRPSPRFDGPWYLAEYKDVAASGVNPLTHYLDVGRKEGRRPLRPQTPSVREIPGACAWSDDRRTIILVAHSAPSTGQFFGAERSFIDMAECLSAFDCDVCAVLPNFNQAYIEELEPFCARIFVTPYGWWDARSKPGEMAIRAFEEIIRRTRADLVYANTIMLREPLIAARKLDVPTAVHCRELIDDDRFLAQKIGLSPAEIVRKVRESADHVIANSHATAKLFMKGGAGVLAPNIIRPERFASRPIDPGMIKVGIVSSNIKKKGIEDFAELALLCKDIPNLEFHVIGPESALFHELKQKMYEGVYPPSLKFDGYIPRSEDAIASIDILLSLSSFGESFGRTVAEAMAAEKLVIAYDAGAIGELVKSGDNGFLVPQGAKEEVARLLADVAANPAAFDAMRRKGRADIIERHSPAALEGAYETLLRSLFNGIVGRALRPPASSRRQTSPPAASQRDDEVTAIVPNYNYARFLPERLQSIARQTRPPSEVIFLDDKSTDDSVSVARRALEESGLPFRVVVNETNEGVYRQWIRGASLARTPWVWIAEADDSCRPDFLERLAGRVRSGVNIIYAQSRKIDEGGVTIADNNLAHTDDICRKKWLENYERDGRSEVLEALAYRNTIPNVSAAILRKAAMNGVEPLLRDFRYCGDWLMYAHMLRTGRIAFEAEPLNDFRRHEESVTRRRMRAPEYLEELARVRLYFAENFRLSSRDIPRLNWFLDHDYKIDGVERNSQARRIAATLRKADDAAGRRRIAFITTNNGSYYGGSEMLWREAALNMRKKGHDVLALIKKWEPRPEFFDELEAHGVKLCFKEERGFETLLAARPDLTVVSIGDQDEGIEYYSRLEAETLDYAIVNQLTKEPRFWPIRPETTEPVSRGYAGARKVFFTCRNNHAVMERRLGRIIENAEIHYNPYHIDRTVIPPWPSEAAGVQFAIPSKLMFIHKGQDLLVEVVSDQKWRGRPATFNFFGVGPDEERLKALAAERRIESFKFHGRVPDIADIWRANHALLMPSRMEGMPIMLVSAMLSGRVSVLTDVGGHAEAVVDGESGFIAGDPTAESLAEAMERAWTARTQWSSMGDAARARILGLLPEDPVEDFVGRVLAIVLARNVAPA